MSSPSKRAWEYVLLEKDLWKIFYHPILILHQEGKSDGYVVVVVVDDDDGDVSVSVVDDNDDDAD